jgi:lipopolysaccharide export system protein LptA
MNQLSARQTRFRHPRVRQAWRITQVILATKAGTRWSRAGWLAACAARTWFLVSPWIGILLAGLLGWALQAQPKVTPAIQATGFTFSGYHPEPNHTRMKFQITGAQGQPEPGNRFRLTQVRVESFRVSGEREMVITAPDCLYDPAKRTASSPGQLKVQTGDERFSVEGQGFLWQGNDSTLAISNQVQSVIHRSTNAAPGDVRLPLIITSKRFEFDLPKVRGVYREQVHGDDPEMEFSCGLLTATGATNTQSFERLMAEQDVSLLNKKDGLQATGDRAVYTRADERMVLDGNAAWKQGRREGRSDRVTLDRREHSLDVEGNVRMKAPRDTLGLGGFFLTTTNGNRAIADEDSPLAELTAGRVRHFPSRSNLTVIQGGVRIVDATNQLSCDTLTVQSGTNVEQTAVAEGNVFVSQGAQGHGIRSERAVYTKADDSMVFTGKPTWQLDQSDGHADRVTVRNSTREIHAEGNVVTKVTLEATQQTLLNFFPESANTNQGPQMIEVFARELTAKERQVTFRGGARAHQSPVTGSEPRLSSDAFELRFGATANSVESIRAVENVVYEQGAPGRTNGPAVYRKLTTRTLDARTDPVKGGLSELLAEGDVCIEQAGNLATGERATYTVATDSFEVAGRPKLETAQMTITDARTLVWDKARNRFTATAPYKIKFKTGSLKDAVAKQEEP